DWPRFVPPFTALRPSPLLTDLPDAHPTTTSTGGTAPEGTADGAPDPAAALRERLAAAGGKEGSEAAKAEILLDLVRGETARVLGIARPAQIKARRGFVEIGFDSLMAVELRNGLSAQTGLALPATLVFDFPAPDDLARHLGEQLADEQSGAGHSVLAEFERLERALDSLSPQGADGADIARRLEALLSRWGGATPKAPEPETDELLDAATPDEMFALIQREFGKS
ncbi:phosphopantetheine-binding protein, partial [Streptomyces albidoflavus]